MAAYGTEAGFETYAEANGWTLPAGDVAAAMLRGSLFVDRYEPRFNGRRTAGYTQDRAWPRTGASTYYGESIPDDAIPQPIIDASYQAAFLELTTPGSLSPVVIGSQSVKREKVGQIEVEYQQSSSASVEDLVALSTPVVTVIEGLLWPFLMPSHLPGILVV